MVVSLIKERDKGSTTLAVGDGANDVNMITTAHIGIGIIGVEGRQAARASDYSIGEFSFLRRLLLVHGREAYRKNSFIVCYNFYKNALFVMPQFWFGIVSLYSGQTLYDPWIYQFYNIIFASIPIIWFGIFDQEVSYDILYNDHRYYTQGLINKLFHSIRFWKWVLIGIIQGAIMFCFFYYSNNSPDVNGRYQDLWSVGSMVYGAIVIIVNIRILYATNNHSLFSFTLFFLTVLSYFIVLIIMSKYQHFENFNNITIIFSNPNYFLSTCSTILLCLILDIAMVKILFLLGAIKDPLMIKPESLDVQLKGQDTSIILNKIYKNTCKINY